MTDKLRRRLERLESKHPSELLVLCRLPNYIAAILPESEALRQKAQIFKAVKGDGQRELDDWRAEQRAEVERIVQEYVEMYNKGIEPEETYDIDDETFIYNLQHGIYEPLPWTGWKDGTRPN